MRAVAPLAKVGGEKRVPISSNNPFISMQQQFSNGMVDALNLFRDLRDELVEQTFHTVYGSPLVQTACGISQLDGPPRARPGLLPSVVAAAAGGKSAFGGRSAGGKTHGGC